jgi:AraC family transcriptional regulator
MPLYPYIQHSMVFDQFPDLQWLKNQAEANFANRNAWQGRMLPNPGWPSVVLNVKTTKTYRDNIRGPLSLFTNLSGVSQVQIGTKTATIKPGFFFLSNQDQRYTLDIHSKTETETLNVHFGEYWIDQVLRTLVASPENLLDESIFTTPLYRAELHTKLYEKNSQVDSVLLELQGLKHDALKEEEKLYELLMLILKEDKRIREIELGMPSVKHSTRQEIIKRLNATTDFIYSNFDKEISLDTLAQLSCMSKFHFLRLFKLAFNTTPHQFVNEVKIKQAFTLLKSTRLDVKEISRNLGFKDSSTFSRLFFNQTGLYPSQIR